MPTSRPPALVTRTIACQVKGRSMTNPPGMAASRAGFMIVASQRSYLPETGHDHDFTFGERVDDTLFFLDRMGRWAGGNPDGLYRPLSDRSSARAGSDGRGVRRGAGRRGLRSGRPRPGGRRLRGSWLAGARAGDGGRRHGQAVG